jgi:poly-beta-1,6 N-acetyl-D-glucosamine synthase
MHDRHAFSTIRRVVFWTTVSLVVLGFFGSLLVLQRPDTMFGAADDGQETSAPQSRSTELGGRGSLLDLTGSRIVDSSPPARTVALTFDDGPDPEWTPLIADLLERNNVRGTFFVIGRKAMAHPGIVRSLYDRGNEIGNHTYTHPRLGRLSDWRLRQQIAMTQRVLASITGSSPKVFRPPYSGSSEFFPTEELAAAKKAARSSGLLTVLSDRAPRDFDPDVPMRTLLAQTLPAIGDGAVITFHDGGRDQQRTLELVQQTIDVLKANGYTFSTISEISGAGAVTTSRTDRVLGWSMLTTNRVVRFFDRGLWICLLVFIPLTIGRVLVMLGLAIRRHRRELRESPPTRRLPSVSVIVPAFNEEVGIEAGLRSIVAGGYPRLEVIVVDDGSTDGTADIVDALALPNVRLIRQSNQGKAHALNAGLLMAQHQIVVFVDGDTLFESNTLHELVQPFADPAVGAVAGNAKVGNRAGLLAQIQHVEYTISSALDRRMLMELGTAGCVPGAVGAFRRTALRSLGGVSSDTLAEDADLTMALARAGWSISFCPTARAWTEVPVTLSGLYKQRRRWAYGTLQSIVKHRGAVWEHGTAGRLGRRSLPYQFIIGFVVALIAPAIDLLAIFQLIFDSNSRAATLTIWLGLNVLGLIPAALALRLERESLRALFVVPLQQFVYRQVLYWASVRSIWAAVSGLPLHWSKLTRVGHLSISGEQVVDVREIALEDESAVELLVVQRDPAA